LLASAVLELERPALLRKAVELALDGDVPMLKFLLGRLLPRDRLLNFEVPRMEFADDGVEAVGRIVRAVAEGKMTPTEGAHLAEIIRTYTAAIETNDIVSRVERLEADIRGIER
jgi:hypothetical protein